MEKIYLAWAFGCEQCQILRINQRFAEHYSYHVQGTNVVGRVLEALYAAGIGWRGKLSPKRGNVLLKLKQHETRNCCLLGCCAMWSGSLPTFHRYLPPS